MRRAALLLSTALIATAIFIAPQSATAHDPGLSSATAVVLPGRIDATVRFHADDLPPDARARDALLASPLLFRVEGAPVAMPPAVVTPAGPEHFEARVEVRVAPTESFELTSPLFDRLPHGHRQYVRVEDAAGEILARRVLSADATSLEVAAVASASSVWQFTQLGFEHILVGWDHLLFLFVLLVACGRPREVVRVVTTFTVAHSASLAISIVGGVQVPGALVEPAIAASVVYVAVRNVFTRSGTNERTLLTFAFGLVHGLGFAGQLTSLLSGGSADVLAPLLGFNVGVELGQLAVAAVLIPLLSTARRSALFVRAGLPGLSAAAGVLGTVWFLERTVF